jgi:hypothetical protein
MRNNIPCVAKLPNLLEECIEGFDEALFWRSGYNDAPKGSDYVARSHFTDNCARHSVF